MNNMIEARGVSKKYNITKSEAPYMSLREQILRLGKQQKKETFWALKDLSFNVKPGECLGIIGKNGAGKSTLLKILSRITPPTEGTISMRGRVASLLEVGTGFHPELNGKENIYLNGSVLGMKASEIKKRMEEIVDFSGVERFLETPLKHYSSGMQMRLAFAVAAHLDPEILLIDEVLAVGDTEFQKKCIGRMGQVSRSGRTVIFVSHDLGSLKSLCPTSILLKQGTLAFHGNTEDAIAQYMTNTVDEKSSLISQKNRKGNGSVIFTKIELLQGSKLIPSNSFISGDQLTIKLHYTVSSTSIKISDVHVGIQIHDFLGKFVTVFNNKTSGFNFSHLPKEGFFECTVDKLPITSGNYSVSAGLIINNILADQVSNISEFSVSPGDFFGTGFVKKEKREGVYIPHNWEIKSDNH